MGRASKKTQAEEAKVRPNPRFDRSNEEIDNTLEEDISLGIIHMIGTQITLVLRIESKGRFALSNK